MCWGFIINSSLPGKGCNLLLVILPSTANEARRMHETPTTNNHSNPASVTVNDSRNSSALYLLFWLGLAIRSVIGLWGHSGEKKPPMFGDFEAQRHWMEITWSIPLGDWYRPTAINDLLYWGLDYPPLTAYVSWIFGWISQYLYPALTQLTVSRGHESIPGKTFMRVSVLLCDALIILPSIVGIVYAMIPSSVSKHMTAWKSSLFYWILAVFVCPSR